MRPRNRRNGTLNSSKRAGRRRSVLDRTSPQMAGTWPWGGTKHANRRTWRIGKTFRRGADGCRWSKRSGKSIKTASRSHGVSTRQRGRSERRRRRKILPGCHGSSRAIRYERTWRAIGERCSRPRRHRNRHGAWRGELTVIPSHRDWSRWCRRRHV